MRRRLAAMALVLIALLTAGCVRTLRHSPTAAATQAEKFLRVLEVDKNVAAAYSMTDPSLRIHQSAADFTDSIERSPGYGYVAAIKATDYRPEPGQPAIWIFLTGQAGTATYYYQLRMNGTQDTGYRPADLGVSAIPWPASNTRQPLNQ